MINKVHSDLEMSLRIEAATEEKCEDICSIRNRNVMCAFQNMIREGQICIFAYIGDKAVGHAACVLPDTIVGAFHVKNSAYIHYCYVEPKYRGHNIYPLMLCQLIKICEMEKNIQRFTIMTSKENISSQQGLKKVGFIFWKNYCCIEWWRLLWKKVLV